MSEQDRAAPRPTLSVLDGIGLVVGVVVGIGIFKTPSLVAANVDGALAFMGLWLLGGLITLAGALVYAELAARHPSAGGEYTFLSRGLGRPTALLFAWARISVIQTGAIAAVAFVFGDYAQAVLPLGPHGGPIYAAAVLAAVTAVNLRGTLHGKIAQNLLSALTFAAILAIVVLGLVLGAPAEPRTAEPSAEPSAGGAPGLAMVFILLTYGGWNEAAYISADVRDGRRTMLRVLMLGTVLIMAVYLLANLAYLSVLGLDGMRGSSVVAADLMERTVGPAGAVLISLAICVAALSTLNASIFTGARIYHALGADLPALRAVGTWDADGNNPRRAILVQSGIALALVLFGAPQRDGFQAIVEYTAPVFWFFMLLVGISYLVLRRRDDHAPRLLTAPLLYPAVPLVFCAACAWLLYASLVHTGLGGLVGVAVLAAGVPLILLAHRRGRLVPAE
ncbi:amino acid permease [Rhodoplanes sp. TEM]|uniref:Amino acid permease n=1 Tax=Rhodoplanes tepidamans TaxID=200616 RepID=A0ABT5JIU7_RHOTP|nr:MULTISPECIES: amino acid permease [Rhodoplanes]MDC7789494.1 amino acid permease [Rhodoplanes tepidamans]MDC7986124.1 amino acid permease [Rhodoplanes sp. TEM]MDQ0358911.1 amino acid transporter [Rhodoplanes tepidamans]